jgi:hypothetical protein
MVDYLVNKTIKNVELLGDNIIRVTDYNGKSRIFRLETRSDWIEIKNNEEGAF